jgi:hypothetical protein
MAKGARDWAQLDAFEAEYRERLAAEKKRGGDSQYLTFLNRLARGRETFWSDEVNARDSETGRLFALRTKILTLREKLGEPEVKLLPVEAEFAGPTAPGTVRSWDDRYDPEKGDILRKNKGIRWLTDPAPPGYVYPVTFEEIKAVLAELPKEHAATVREIRLSNQKRTGADGDWLDGEIRLHCLVQEGADADGAPTYRRQMGRSEGGADVERWGGWFEWEGNKPLSVWPRESYKTFVLRRVLIHEVAHGVAELPGQSDAVRRAGSVERFCELYAENFYRPPGRSVRLGF